MLSREEWSIPKVQPADVLSLESLIAWLEKQPRDRYYSALPVSSCLLGQFAKAMGSADPAADSFNLGDLPIFKDIAFDNVTECTFGAALERARKFTAA